MYSKHQKQINIQLETYYNKDKAFGGSSALYGR